MAERDDGACVNELFGGSVSTTEQTHRNIVVNGRFLSRRITGVERYAIEVIKRLPGQVRILQHYHNGIRGHCWEQFVLPFRCKGDLLWSPCNTGPMFAKRHVVTIHDTGFVDVPGFYDRKMAAFYRQMIPRLLSRVCHVITVSQFSKRQIMQHYHLRDEQITAIPLGANGFAPASLKQVSEVINAYKLPTSYLLTVGSIKPGKNTHRLIEAWSRTKLAAGGMELVVAGVAGAVFAKYVLGEPPPGVRFLGYVSDDDLPALYTGALAFVLPSLYEGFGLPAVEAMACGTPVICSNITSLPEVVGDAALLVDPTDVDSIANGLTTMVESNTLRAQFRERGANRVNTFNWQRTADATWKLLQSLTT